MSFDQITVVINTFNSEDKIYNCLDSIRNDVKVIVKMKYKINTPMLNAFLQGKI